MTQKTGTYVHTNSIGLKKWSMPNVIRRLKLYQCLTNYALAMKAYEGAHIYIHIFLKLALSCKFNCKINVTAVFTPVSVA
jgi:hypothetical protein